jgi:hypothetical protein
MLELVFGLVLGRLRELHLVSPLESLEQRLLRKDSGLGDAPGRRLVGTKSEYASCVLLSSRRLHHLG